VTVAVGARMSPLGIFVTLYMEEQVLTGSVFLPSYIRLSDFLNEKVFGMPEIVGPFLELTEVSIACTDGLKERKGTERVSKADLRLLAMPDNNLARGIGGKYGPKPYPYVRKFPVQLRMRVSSYELTGNAHRIRGQGIQQLLEETPMFLPITNAKIRVNNSDIWQRAIFVAVNKKHVSSIQPQEIPIVS